MSDISVEHEPTPPPRASGTRIKGGLHVQLVEEKTGKVVSDVVTPDYLYVNERRLREEPKY
jgi:hypothetical protein